MMETHMRNWIVLTLFVAVSAAGHAQSLEKSNTQLLTVELSSFKFTPASLTLDRGVTYRIHFMNTSSGGHDFVAKEFFAASTVAPEDRAKVENGSVGVDGREAVDVTLVANKPGTYKMHCSHFLHSSFGMTGLITVR